MQHHVSIIRDDEGVSINPELVRQRQLPNILERHVRANDAEQIGGTLHALLITLAVEDGYADGGEEPIAPGYLRLLRRVLRLQLVLVGSVSDFRLIIVLALLRVCAVASCRVVLCWQSYEGVKHTGRKILLLCKNQSCYVSVQQTGVCV